MDKQDYNYFAKKFQETKNDKWFERLYESLEFGLRIYVKKILKNKDPELINDVMNEAFAQSYLKIDQFKPEYSFTTWLYRIARNLALNLIKKESRTQRVDFNLPTLHTEVEKSGTFNSSDFYDYQDDIEIDGYESDVIIKNMIHRCISNMDSTYGKLLFDYHFNEFSYKEMSHKYNLNINTVKTRIRRGRTQLGYMIKDERSELIEEGKIEKEELKI